MLRRMEKCVEVMRHWMEANTCVLKVNDEKIEVMLFTPKHVETC